ncbi:polynucleotide 5'-hydroxyl-kinase [Rhodotorula paludigena]|uniref:polynucleotide 5'-hydroxyl-kinase n=1 Tax=Rhodotorula paludigena TaxID=86838 RepID=UPI0031716DA4
MTPAPAKKRKRTADPPAPAPPAAQPAAAPSPAPVLSAVAARRAARLAAAAATSAPEPAAAPASAPTRAAAKARSPTPPVEDELEASDGGASTSAESDAAPDVETRPSKARKPTKGKGAARYFAAQDDEPEERPPAGMMEVDDGAVSPPEGLEPASDREADMLELGTPVRSRRRREKTAFIDPNCASAFHYLDGVNAVRTTVLDEDGGERDAVLYALQPEESLIVRGACTLMPVVGSVTVFGSHLAAPAATSSTHPLPPLLASTSYPLFAPSSHPVPPIRAIASPAADRPASLLLPSGETLDLTRYVSVVLVTDLVSGIEGIERVFAASGMGCGVGMFSRRGGGPEPSLVGARGGKTWSLVLEPEPGLAALQEVEPWTAALSAFLPPPPQAATGEADGGRHSDRFVAVVEGPKRVGKSTFAKMLVNQLLDRYEAVAYLDTDLGQPEFTAPGFVSLNVLRRPVLGPAFTHLSVPISSHYLGSTSPASDPTAYLAAASALLSTYSLEVEYALVDEPRVSARGRRTAPVVPAALESRKIRERVPLVLNTQGWVKGLGADLLNKLKSECRPTHVFSFADPEAPDAFSAMAPPPEGLPFAFVPLTPAPPSPLESKWSASDYRILSLVSYFHAVFPSNPPAPSALPSNTLATAWNFEYPLVAQAPYALDWRSAEQQLAQVHLLEGGEIPYTHVLHVLSGALVAVVQDGAVSGLSTPRSFPYDSAAPAPTPASSRALGLALVHSVSPTSSTLHLSTPLPAALVDSVAPISLAKGALDLPLPLMLDFTATERETERGIAGVEWSEVPFLTVEAGEAAGRRKVRRNLMRRGQA